MGREIKFRVWDNVDYMSKPFTLQSLMDANRTEFTSDCIVMQYTGLKDRNGKEIYEGDIIHSDCLGEKKVCPVQWQEHGFWMADYIDAEGTWHGGWWPKPEYMEVIGNIHENPELLKS